MQGDNNDDGNDGIATATYQLDIFGAKAEDARQVADNMQRSAKDADPTKRGIDNYAGTIDNTKIMWARFGTQRVTQAIHVEGQNQTLARCVLEVILTYRELN